MKTQRRRHHAQVLNKTACIRWVSELKEVDTCGYLLPISNHMQMKLKFYIVESTWDINYFVV